MILAISILMMIYFLNRHFQLKLNDEIPLVTLPGKAALTQPPDDNTRKISIPTLPKPSPKRIKRKPRSSLYYKNKIARNRKRNRMARKSRKLNQRINKK